MQSLLVRKSKHKEKKYDLLPPDVQWKQFWLEVLAVLIAIVLSDYLLGALKWLGLSLV